MRVITVEMQRSENIISVSKRFDMYLKDLRCMNDNKHKFVEEMSSYDDIKESEYYRIAKKYFDPSKVKYEAVKQLQSPEISNATEVKASEVIILGGETAPTLKADSEIKSDNQKDEEFKQELSSKIEQIKRNFDKINSNKSDKDINIISLADEIGETISDQKYTATKEDDISGLYDKLKESLNITDEILDKFKENVKNNNPEIDNMDKIIKDICIEAFKDSTDISLKEKILSASKIYFKSIIKIDNRFGQILDEISKMIAEYIVSEFSSNNEVIKQMIESFIIAAKFEAFKLNIPFKMYIKALKNNGRDEIAKTLEMVTSDISMEEKIANIKLNEDLVFDIANATMIIFTKINPAEYINRVGICDENLEKIKTVLKLNAEDFVEAIIKTGKKNPKFRLVEQKGNNIYRIGYHTKQVKVFIDIDLEKRTVSIVK